MVSEQGKAHNARGPRLGSNDDPNFRRLRGQLSAAAQLALYDPHETTKAARAAFESRWDKLVPPEITDPAERARRAAMHRRAWYLRFSMKGTAARKRNAAARRAAKLTKGD